MECKFCGTQPIDIRWYRDDKEIHSDAKYMVETKENMAALLIRGLGESDGGNYRCRLTNVAGQKDDTGTLSVKGQKSSNTIGQGRNRELHSDYTLMMTMTLNLLTLFF